MSDVAAVIAVICVFIILAVFFACVHGPYTPMGAVAALLVIDFGGLLGSLRIILA